MTQHKKHQHFLIKTTLNAGKTPFLYTLIGCLLVALSYIDDIFRLTDWKYLFDITDKLGKIFVALAVITFVYNFIVAICLHYERQHAEKKKIATMILSTLRRSLRVIFTLIFINAVIILLEPNKSLLLLAYNVINTIIIGSIGWFALQILYTYEAMIHQNMTSLHDEAYVKANALYTKMHILRNILTVLIIIITVSVILMSFSSVRNIGISLLASAGFLTAMVGLSAQKTLSSLFSGIQIAFSQTIKIGDIVVIDENVGTIEEITFTFVTLKILDNRQLIIPINYFVEKPFENWSRDYKKMLSSFSIFVSYAIPIEPIRHELNRILQSSQFWNGSSNKIEVYNLNERSVELRIQISAKNADNLANLRSEVREKLLVFIQKEYPDYLPKQIDA